MTKDELFNELDKRKMTLENIEEYIKFEDELIKRGFTFKSVIEAREKQVAKKPRINRVSNDAEYMKCPQCRLTTVLYSDMRPDYCPKCGQKLDWSE